MGIYFPVLNGIISIILLLIFIVTFIYLSINDIRKKENHDYKGDAIMISLACVSLGLIIVIARKVSNDWSTPTKVTFLPIL
jgi:hypothetical protein